jgi:uncharacterized membrane protein (DUF485 family)
MSEHDHPVPARESIAVGHNRRIGLWLFAIYLAFYGGFVGLVSVDFAATKVIVFAGLNLATVYGFALIIGAFAIALVYMYAAKHDAGETK